MLSDMQSMGWIHSLYCCDIYLRRFRRTTAPKKGHNQVTRGWWGLARLSACLNTENALSYLHLSALPRSSFNNPGHSPYSSTTQYLQVNYEVEYCTKELADWPDFQRSKILFLNSERLGTTKFISNITRLYFSSGPMYTGKTCLIRKHLTRLYLGNFNSILLPSNSSNGKSGSFGTDDCRGRVYLTG